jgi:NitT/TauT family transport system substrate-binding protein
MPQDRHGFLRTSSIAGAAVLLAPRPARADDVPVRIASAVGDDVTPILYGQQQGLFRRAGLDVRLQVLTSGSAGAAAVVGGSLDIAKSSLMAIVLAHARGIPLRIIAPAAFYTSSQLFAAMVVGKNSPLQNARSLAGKTIAVTSLSDVQALSTMSWIDQNGGDSTAVKFLEIPSTAMVAAVEDARVDAAVLVSPILDSAVHTGRARVMGPVYSGIANRFLVTVWYATDAYIARNADTVRRFAATVREANAYCMAHPAETLPIIAAFEHIDPATLQGTVRASYPATLDARDIQPMIDAAVKYKLIDKPFPASELVSANP